MLILAVSNRKLKLQYMLNSANNDRLLSQDTLEHWLNTLLICVSVFGQQQLY